MKLGLGVLGALVVAWLALWVADMGVLVQSAAGKIPTTRECHYFIGVSVVKRYEVLAERCGALVKLGK